jgi:hypothetical protein
MTTSVLKQTTPGGSPFYETKTVIAADSVSSQSSITNACGSYQYLISSVVDSASSALSASEVTIDSTGLI